MKHEENVEMNPRVSSSFIKETKCVSQRRYIKIMTTVMHCTRAISLYSEILMSYTFDYNI